LNDNLKNESGREEAGKKIDIRRRGNNFKSTKNQLKCDHLKSGIMRRMYAATEKNADALDATAHFIKKKMTQMIVQVRFP